MTITKLAPKDWFLYLIRTGEGSLYTGVTTDIQRRFREHREGGKKAAKYLRSKEPLALEYQVKIGTRVLALQVEYRVKNLTKQKKEEIVKIKLGPRRFLKLLGF